MSKTTLIAASLAAGSIALTGAVLANAASDPSTSSGSSSTASSSSSSSDDSTRQAPRLQDDGRSLTADDASKAIAKALEKVPGNVKGVHLDRDGSGFEVMIVQSDGTPVGVVVSDDFTTATIEQRGPGIGPGGPRGHHGRPGVGNDHSDDRDDSDTSSGSSDPTDANGTAQDSGLQSSTATGSSPTSITL